MDPRTTDWINRHARKGTYPDLNLMVKAVSQLQDCTTLTGELSLEVIEAFKARPAYYLFDLFEFGLLLYNQRVINTWTVDVRYIHRGKYTSI